MRLRTSDNYDQVVEKAGWSHEHGRSVFHIHQEDIDLGRLFSYAYRSQTIGTFHATRVALESEVSVSRSARARAYLETALALLEQLEARAIDLVPQDWRAVISTLHYYDRWSNATIEALEAAACEPDARIELIKDLFCRNLESITTCAGPHIANDLKVPEQGTFIVPSLNIAIVPVVYGDHHSWNVAYLPGERSGVPLHRHHRGAEIHLGFSPVQGRTILGSCIATVEEGYAMPIPPMTDHGFHNTSGHDHLLPFIFGSLPMAGWGVFFDVEPRTENFSILKESALESVGMNHSIFLEREIQRLASTPVSTREVLIGAKLAGASETGGLELAGARVDAEGTELTSNSYRIVSVQRGVARALIGEIQIELREHDHFGVPAGMPAHIMQAGSSPAVILDATIVPLCSSGEVR